MLTSEPLGPVRTTRLVFLSDVDVVARVDGLVDLYVPSVEAFNGANSTCGDELGAVVVPAFTDIGWFLRDVVVGETVRVVVVRGCALTTVVAAGAVVRAGVTIFVGAFVATVVRVVGVEL